MILIALKAYPDNADHFAKKTAQSWSYWTFVQNKLLKKQLLLLPIFASQIIYQHPFTLRYWKR